MLHVLVLSLKLQCVELSEPPYNLTVSGMQHFGFVWQIIVQHSIMTLTVTLNPKHFVTLSVCFPAFYVKPTVIV